MPKSLKVMIKKLVHDGHISSEECGKLLAKLDGHDASVRAEAIASVKDLGKLYSEIRAEAIDEFAERLSNWCADECFLKSIDGIQAELLTLDGITDMIFELAEQLKEKENEFT